MKRLALLLAALLLFGACDSTNHGVDDLASDAGPAIEITPAPSIDASATPVPTARGTTGTGAGPSAAPSGGNDLVPTPAPGAIRSPISVGFVRTATSNLAAFGVLSGSQISEAAILDGIIAAFNAAGGVAGRPIRPVISDTDTGSASWEADFAKACAAFTQDHKVDAVVGYVFDHNASFESCLTKKGIPHLSTTYNVPDAKEFAANPGLFSLTNPSIERRSKAKIDGALATGVFTKSSKIGVLTDGCPTTARAWPKTVRPYMLSKGLTITDHVAVGCPQGAEDAGGAVTAVQNSVLRFQTKGIDRVVFFSVSEGPLLLVFGTAAETQLYTPTYVVSSLANTAYAAGNVPERQLRNVKGFGWFPASDVPPSKNPGASASTKRCIAMLKSKGINVTAAIDISAAHSVCEGLFALEAALRRTNGRSDGASLRSAVEGFGTKYISVTNLNGASSFSHTRHDGPSLIRPFAWDGACKCFAYFGTAKPF